MSEIRVSLLGVELIDSLKTPRNNKGKSIIDFPKDYVIIDIETTGLSPQWDEIIELSAIRYRNNEKVDEYSTLVKPEEKVDSFITELTGITNNMLKHAPSIEDCIKDFYDFIADDILVGYNVNFDINFIYDNMICCLEKPLTNNFVDVMRLARKELKELPRHSQSIVAQYFNIDTSGAHRALEDCKICNQCLENIKKHIIDRGITLEEFYQSFKTKPSIKSKDIVGDQCKFNPDHVLFEKNCVFTGTLEKMSRATAFQIVADIGAHPCDNVNKKTDYLILGNNDYCKSIKDGKSIKHKKAEELILKGVNISIITEQEFYDLIDDV